MSQLSSPYFFHKILVPWSPYISFSQPFWVAFVLYVCIVPFTGDLYVAILRSSPVLHSPNPNFAWPHTSLQCFNGSEWGSVWRWAVEDRIAGRIAGCGSWRSVCAAVGSNTSSPCWCFLPNEGSSISLIALTDCITQINWILNGIASNYYPGTGEKGKVTGWFPTGIELR